MKVNGRGVSKDDIEPECSSRVKPLQRQNELCGNQMEANDQHCELQHTKVPNRREAYVNAPSHHNKYHSSRRVAGCGTSPSRGSVPWWLMPSLSVCHIPCTNTPSREIVKDMLFLCIEIIFGIISGCRNLERIFADCRSNTVILVHNTKEVGEHIKEKED